MLRLVPSSMCPVVLVLASGLVGCYQSHVLDVEGGLRRDGGGLLDAPRGDGPDPGPDVPLSDAARPDAPADPCATVDCPPSPVACAASVCRDGACFLIPIPDGCPPGATCDPSRGCVFVFDAGPPDAGRDAAAPLDAPAPRDAPARDAPVRDAPALDAPRDAPRADAPRLDAPADAPRPDAPRPDGGRDAGPPTSTAFRCTPSTVITVNNRTLLSVGPEVTFELWVRARGTGMIAGKGEVGGRRHLALRLEPSVDGSIELVGGWTTGTAAAELRVPFGASMGRWTHVAMVQRLDASAAVVTLEIWLDAVLVASASFPDTTAGAFNDVPLLMCQLDADLDEVRIWSAARAPSLIAAQRFGMVPTNSPGLLAYWPLEGMRQVQLDRTLLGNDAFLGITSVADAADPTSISDGAF